MAKKKNPNRKALQIKGKYGKKSQFYGKSEEDIESIKKRKRDKRAEQQENKAKRDRLKRRQDKGIGRFAPKDLPATGPTPEPVDLDSTVGQLPVGQIPSEPGFDYEGALADMRAEFEERQRLADEKYSRQVAEFEQGERTQMENQARAGQQTEYKLGSPSERMRGGTFGFRRRKRRLMGGIGAVNSLAAGAASGMLNF